MARTSALDCAVGVGPDQEGSSPLEARALRSCADEDPVWFLARVRSPAADVVVSSGADMSALIGRLGVTDHRSGVTLAESYDGCRTTRRSASCLPSSSPASRPDTSSGPAPWTVSVTCSICCRRGGPTSSCMTRWSWGSPTAAALHGIPHVTHGYGPMVPNTSYFAAAIAAAISDAGLPDPAPDIFAAPYLDICPPSLRGTEPNPWTTIHRLRPSPGETDACAGPSTSSSPPDPASTRRRSDPRHRRCAPRRCCPPGPRCA